MTRPRPVAVAVALVALVAVSCGGGGSKKAAREGRPVTTTTAAPTTTTSPPPSSIATSAAPTTPAPTTARPAAPATTRAATPPPPPAALASVRVRLTRVATLSQPVAMAVRPGDTALYVAEKTGGVRAIRNGAVDPAPVVDLSGQVSTGSEQGLLGLAFSDDGRLLYLNYTDRAGDTHIVEVTLATGGRRDLLFVNQPYPNHNGGQLVVRPDGTLWIGLGDGGSGGDPQGNAQNLGTLLGKILRIDPRPSAGQAYRIPAGNPFVGRAGARPEIWAYGLRNPWRFSFDRATNDLWIGDVGQNQWEEVDLAPASAGDGPGRNYGWNAMEGSHTYKGSPPPGAVGPLFDFSHAGGNCSVIGGYVYRGTRIPGLQGAYLYGDYCVGEVLAVRQQGGRVTERADLGMKVSALTSFGEDQGGELYALSEGGAVSRVDPA